MSKKIAIKDLNISYPNKTIFDNFSIEFEPQKVNIILGDSGIGKTTLLGAIAGLIKTDAVDTDNATIAYIFQKDRLIPSISIYKNLDLILKGKIKDKTERKNLIENMMRKLEIFEHKDKLPTEISGGEAQRVNICRAYLFDSDIVLLDEPFKGLDTALKMRLINLLIDLDQETKKTVVFVTHAIDECLGYGDNYFVFKNNPVEVVASGQITIPKNQRKLSDPCLEEIRIELLRALVD